MKIARRSEKGILLYFCLFSLVHAAALEAAQLHLSFWPTAIVQQDPDSTGSLYAWPEFKVLLQNKSASSVFSPAEIDRLTAAQLTTLFAPKLGSAIEIMRDEANASWGMAIKGGSNLRQENLELLEPMVQSFISCLATGNEQEVDRMKEVIYAPHLLLSPSGGLNISEEQRQIANRMAANYERNRCEGGSASIPELVQNKVRQYFTVMLRGQGRDVEVTDGVLLVLTNLFKDLLFAPKGLWVRSVLAKIQEHITERMKSFPAVQDGSWLERNYDSFIDFVLLTKNQHGFNKHQYLNIAAACGVDDIGDAFKPFLLKQCLTSGQLLALHLHLGSNDSTHYLKGGKE